EGKFAPELFGRGKFPLANNPRRQRRSSACSHQSQELLVGARKDRSARPCRLAGSSWKVSKSAWCCRRSVTSIGPWEGLTVFSDTRLPLNMAFRNVWGTRSI